MALYGDLNQEDFTAHPVLEDVEAVYQSISNIFSTTPGERLFRPEFGVDLERQLFTPVTDLQAAILRNIVVGGLANNESRVSVNNSSTSIIPIPDEKMFDINMEYSVVGIQDIKFNYKAHFVTEPK